MIKFKKLWGEGFGSFIQETKFKLDRPGLNIIIAENGDGKTTTFSILHWILFGEGLKKVKEVGTWEIFRGDNYKGTKCRVKFSRYKDEYEIIRCKDYTGEVLNAKGANRLIIIKNNVPLIIRDKKDQQKEVNKIIGYSSELFSNSIIFGQRMKRLIEESGPNKKSLFEEAFEANFLNSALKRAEEDYKACKKDYEGLSHKKDINLLNYQNAKDKYLIQIANYHAFEKNKENSLTELLDDLATTKKQLENQNDLLDLIGNLKPTIKSNQEKLDQMKSGSNIAELEKREFILKNQLDKTEYQLGMVESKLKRQKLLKLGISERCPRCKAKLKGDGPKKEKSRIEEDILILKGEVESLITQVQYDKTQHVEALALVSSNEILKSDIRELEREIRILESKEKTKQSCQISINHYTEDIKKIDSKILTLKNTKMGFDLKPLIKDKRALKEVYLSSKLELKETFKRLNNLKWLVSEALSNKGIKAYVFDTMLKQLNNQLRYYMQFIGMVAEFRIDFSSANKDLFAVVHFENGFQGYYEELSGGQKQLIDVATAFAMHDLIVAGRGCNLMVLDEIFEGLSEKNVDIVLDLIQDKAKDKSLFLITHNLNLQNSSTKVIKLHRNKAGQTVFKSLLA